jgi:hypothetical protein
MTGPLRLGGSIIDDGATLTVPASQPVSFVGSAPQHVTGSAPLRLDGPARIEPGATLEVGATSLLNNGSLTIAGSLRVDQGAMLGGSGPYVYDATTGTLIFDSPDPVVVGSQTWWPSTNGPAFILALRRGWHRPPRRAQP